jgi:hypothetical protein
MRGSGMRPGSGRGPRSELWWPSWLPEGSISRKLQLWAFSQFWRVRGRFDTNGLPWGLLEFSVGLFRLE